MDVSILEHARARDQNIQIRSSAAIISPLRISHRSLTSHLELTALRVFQRNNWHSFARNEIPARFENVRSSSVLLTSAFTPGTTATLPRDVTPRIRCLSAPPPLSSAESRQLSLMKNEDRAPHRFLSPGVDVSVTASINRV